MANGRAISALAGRKEYMSQILSLGLTLTFFRMPDAMAAANATIEAFISKDICQQLKSLGETLMSGIDRAAEDVGVPCRAIGLPSTPYIAFQYSSSISNKRALRLFCNGMLSRGILMSPNHHWFICAAMTEEDIHATVDGAREVFKEIKMAS